MSDTGKSGRETSRSLLALVRDEDDEAWSRLVSLYSPLIYYWCKQMDLPDQEMPDVFQEIFQAVSRGIKKFQKSKEGGSFRGWLRVVTRNKVIDHFRKQSGEPGGVGGTDAQRRWEEVAFREEQCGQREEDREPETEGEQAIYRGLFMAAVEAVRPGVHERTWAAFWGMVIDGKAAAVVGEELGMQPGNVRVAKSRVLSRIRRELGELGE